MGQESMGGAETMGGGGGSSSSITLAQAYLAGLSGADSTVTLDATRAGVVITATGLADVVPLTVNNTTTDTSGAQGVVAITGSLTTASGASTFTPLSVAYTINQTGTASGAVTGVLVNATETAVLGAHKLLDLQVAGVSRFSVAAQSSVASATSASLDVVNVPGQTVTVTGSTAITAAVGFNYVNISSPTYSAASGPAITNAATFVIQGPPTLAGASAPVVTNLTALKVNGTWANTVNAGHCLRIVPTFAPTSGTGTFNVFGAGYTINQTGGANGTITGLLLSATETAVVGTHNFIDLQVGGTSRWKVANTAATTIDCTATSAAVPLTVLNAKTNSGYVAQVTATAATGYTLNNSSGTQKAAFGFAVSANDWITGTAAGDAVLAGDPVKKIQFGALAAAAPVLTIDLAAGQSVTAAGTLAAPAITLGQANLGFYRSSADIMGVSVAGIRVMRLFTTTVSIDNSISLGVANNITSLSACAVQGNTDGNTGISFPGGADTASLVAGGTEILRWKGATAAIGVFTKVGTPAVQQTSGADLTNSVTSGGTDDTIGNFTDLTTYANDAATIRNNQYQLARKLKQVNDGLRALGWLT